MIVDRMWPMCIGRRCWATSNRRPRFCQREAARCRGVDRFQAPRAARKKSVGEKDVHVTRTGDFRFGDRGMVCQRRQTTCARSRGFCPRRFASCKRGIHLQVANSGLEEPAKAEAPVGIAGLFANLSATLAQRASKLGGRRKTGMSAPGSRKTWPRTLANLVVSRKKNSKMRKASSARRPPKRRGASYRGGGNEGGAEQRAVSYLRQANFLRDGTSTRRRTIVTAKPSSFMPRAEAGLVGFRREVCFRRASHAITSTAPTHVEGRRRRSRHRGIAALGLRVGESTHRACFVELQISLSVCFSSTQRGRFPPHPAVDKRPFPEPAARAAPAATAAAT